MAVTYGKYGMSVIDSGSNTGSYTNFTMACGDQNSNYDLVQANLRFTGATEDQWLFTKLRAGLTSYKNVIYRAQGAGTSSTMGSTNGSLWSTYAKNRSNGDYSYAQFTIKNMHSDSNPFGDTTLFCRYLIRIKQYTVQNWRNDYTFARARVTGCPDKIECYFQNGNVTGYEYKVYGFASSD